MALHRDEDGKLSAYAWPGGYPVLYSDKQGNTLCPECANREIDPGQAVVDSDIYWEGPPLSCDDCGKGIVSAYGDPDEGGED